MASRKYAVGTRHITAKGIIEITRNENGMVTYFYVNNPSHVVTNKLVNLMSNINKFKHRQLAKGINVTQLFQNMNCLRKLKFGVELEVATTTVTRAKAARVFNEHGINAITSRYGSPVSRSWKIQPDGSINGFEVVSPILTDFEELKKVVYILKNELHVRTSVKCGLHVHHDIKDLSLSQIKILYQLYSKYESNAIASIIDPRRKYNRYCLQIAPVAHNVLNANSIQEFKQCIDSRYYAVNNRCYVKYGTIEFRGHGTSLNIDTIISWIKLTHKMVEASTVLTEVGPLQATNDKEALEELYREIGLTDIDVITKQKRLQKYWSRRQHLA